MEKTKVYFTKVTPVTEQVSQDGTEEKYLDINCLCTNCGGRFKMQSYPTPNGDYAIPYHFCPICGKEAEYPDANPVQREPEPATTMEAAVED